MEPEKIQEKAVQLRRDYYRAWYKNHPGKNSEYKRRYWTKKARVEILRIQNLQLQNI